VTGAASSAAPYKVVPATSQIGCGHCVLRRPPRHYCGAPVTVACVIAYNRKSLTKPVVLIRYRCRAHAEAFARRHGVELP
jgi:hypothetical protein